MKKVLILSSVWCEPNSSAAGVHMKQIILFLSSQKFEISYATTANWSEFKEDFSFLESYSERQIALNESSVDAWFASLNPNLVIFDRFIVEEQFGWKIREQCPNALNLLNTEDLHSLRKSRQEALKQNIEFSVDFWKTQEICLREIASIFRCDATLLVSKIEIELLKKEFSIPDYLLHFLPLKYSNPLETPSFSERTNFVSIGNYLHEPNLDSVRFVKEKLWDTIRKALPKAEFHSYGAYPNTKSDALHDPKNGFYIKGRVENVAKCLQQYKVCLAPLRFGAGIKGKFLDAMSNGLPSVTTEIGAEAMAKADEWPGFVINKEEELIEKAILLYQNAEIWKEKQKQGYAILHKNFSGVEEYENFEKLVSQSQEEMHKNRKSNFIGEMFKHHSNNSSKYFSKWIEAKNK